MTDKQREATKIVLQQCSEGHLDADEALTIIDSIVGEPQIQYIPLATDPKPTWPTSPIITYGTGDPAPPADQFRVTCDNSNGRTYEKKGGEP